VGSAGLCASDPRRVREGEAFVNSVVDLEGIKHLKEFGLQSFVVLLLLMAAIMALIYGLKYQEDVSRGKPKNDDDDRWWGMM
jgi:hypothetical protein